MSEHAFWVLMKVLVILASLKFGYDFWRLTR